MLLNNTAKSGENIEEFNRYTPSLMHWLQQKAYWLPKRDGEWPRSSEYKLKRQIHPITTLDIPMYLSLPLFLYLLNKNNTIS